MKNICMMMIMLSAAAFGQFKQKPSVDEPRVADSFIQPATASEWFSLFNPNNFQMHHSYSASYTASGKYGLALQQYTNTMMYKFAPNLDARVDISLMNSPYSTFDNALQNKFSSLYLNRAEISYRPWENTQIRLSYRQLPFNYFGYSNYGAFGGMFSTLDDYGR